MNSSALLPHEVPASGGLRISYGTSLMPLLGCRIPNSGIFMANGEVLEQLLIDEAALVQPREEELS